MKRHIILCIGAYILYPFAAFADVTLAGFTFVPSFGFVSEYSYRGISQSDKNIALQADIDVSHSSGLYAGLFGSNVDFNSNDNASVEIDYYLGYQGDIYDFTYDIGAIYYSYPNSDSSLKYEYVEGKFSLGYEFGIFSAHGSVNYSPSYFGGSGSSLYYSLGGAASLTDSLVFSGHVGYQTIGDATAFGVGDNAYADWSIGMSFRLILFDLSISYLGTDLLRQAGCASGLCGNRVIFGLAVAL